MKKIRIGTRGSKLALYQAELVQSKLQAAHPGLTCELIKIQTSGDKLLTQSLAKLGGKGLFLKEIEEALLAGDVDIAVHSMKDVPAVDQLPPALEIACILERENPFDAFISHKFTEFSQLPQGAKLGTSSIRRAAFLLNKRPDLKIVNFRGNVQTRLQKLEAGEVDATLLACAGLNRLQLNEHPCVRHAFELDTLPPAIGQGAIGVEIRNDDDEIRQFLNSINCQQSFIEVSAERSFMEKMEGSCNTPLVALATIVNDKLTLIAAKASDDGKKIWRATATGNPASWRQLGYQCAAEVLGG
jgi:hydroxymethylbilane synthase